MRHHDGFCRTVRAADPTLISRRERREHGNFAAVSSSHSITCAGGQQTVQSHPIAIGQQWRYAAATLIAERTAPHPQDTLLMIGQQRISGPFQIPILIRPSLPADGSESLSFCPVRPVSYAFKRFPSAGTMPA